jgi:N-acetylglucosamine-6-phosphate deacetylase
MGPFHHRDAGLIGFALSSDAIVAEIIGDLVHVGPEAFEVALAAKGPRHLALVSDALRGAGSGCEVFESHGHRCRSRDGAIWIEDPGVEPRLTGAAASQLEAIRRLVGAGVLALPEALTMATEAPARALGREGELGRLAPSARADLLLLRAGSLEVAETVVAGSGIPLAAGR